MLKIPYINLTKQWLNEREELQSIFEKIMLEGHFVGGESIEKFEKNVSKFCGSKYCIAMNSGTDALVASMYSLGIGKNDEVLTPPNSFVASTSSIVHLGAKPVFIEVSVDQNIDINKIENYITKNTKAIMPVHLTGRMANM